MRLDVGSPRAFKTKFLRCISPVELSRPQMLCLSTCTFKSLNVEQYQQEKVHNLNINGTLKSNETREFVNEREI